jgi:release factor glutamine methyltransferase
MEIKTKENIYEPAEDSYLIQGVIDKLDLKDKLVLEIGTGSGILAITAAAKGARVTAVDINLKALALAKSNSKLNNTQIDFIHSDMFDNIKGSYDYIFCNSPYLPEDAHEIDDAMSTAITGGKEGYEWCVEFLKQAQSHLNPKGKIYLLFSTLSKPKKILAAAEKSLYTTKKITEESLFFEKILVYEFFRSPILNFLYSLNIKKISYVDRGRRGVVYHGFYDGVSVAIKMHKEASKATHALANEAKWLKALNKLGIGPKFIVFKDNAVIREFVDGERINNYLTQATEKQAREALNEIFRQCRVLDKNGIEKQEMKNPYKHILVGKEITMIDFERCRERESPSNITQLVQWVGSSLLTKILSEKNIKYDIKELRDLVKIYKYDMTEKNYKKIITFLS